MTVASDDGLNGSYSFAISGFGGLAKLLTQTISFSPPTTVYMSQSPLALVATASSGLPVTLSVVSGPADLTGNALTLNAPGTVKVLAIQAGAGNFLPARSVLRTLAVKADPSTLTLINLTPTYDGQPKAPSTIPAGATLTYKQGTTVVAAPTNAGAYTVTAVLGGDHQDRHAGHCQSPALRHARRPAQVCRADEPHATGLHLQRLSRN